MPRANTPVSRTSASRLMSAAERLIGEHGYHNVSLVQIARAAGQANKYAVQYHFGTKENLVRGIFDDRLARIAARRRLLLDALDTRGHASVRELVHAFIYPVYEEVDDRGFHTYARFAERMLETELPENTWFSSSHFGTTAEIRNRLSALTPHLAPEEFSIRYRLISALLIQSLSLADRVRVETRPPAAETDASGGQILERAIDIAANALVMGATPIGETL